MSILINKNSNVVVQGITGSEGQFHSKQMIEYGTNIVAGVTPGKGGQKTLDGNVPVYNMVIEAVEKENANTSIIFVPPAFAADAIIEAALAGIKVIVCITEGVPVQDMTKAKQIVKKHNIHLVGPNCPGIITVDECKLGIMPGFICKKGNIGVISKSGTLTYEAIDQLVHAGLGQTTEIDKETLKKRVYYKDFRACSSHPHSYAFEFLSEYGLVGFLFYVGLIAIFFINLYKIRNKKKNKEFFLFIATSSLILAIIFPLKPSGSFLSTFNASMLFYVIGFNMYFFKEIK